MFDETLIFYSFFEVENSLENKYDPNYEKKKKKIIFVPDCFQLTT